MMFIPEDDDTAEKIREILLKNGFKVTNLITADGSTLDNFYLVEY